MTEAAATSPESIAISILTRRTAIAQRLSIIIARSSAEVRTHAAADAALAALPAGPACFIVDAGDESCLSLIDGLRKAQRQIPVLALVPAKNAVTTPWLALIGHPLVGVLHEPLEDKVIVTQLRGALDLAQKWWEQDRVLLVYRARLAMLTARERQILMLIVAGKLNKQIAVELGIAGRTVEIHRGRVLHKLEAGNIAEAARILIFAHPDWTNTPPASPVRRPAESALLAAG